LVDGLFTFFRLVAAGANAGALFVEGFAGGGLQGDPFLNGCRGVARLG
jgi:hypothetical protein